MIGILLDVYKANSENLFHWPAAVLGSLTLEMNRDHETRPEPFTPWDVMPHLGQAPERPDAEIEQQTREKGLFYSLQGMPGVAMVLEPD